MIYLLVGSHIIIKGKRHLHSNSRIDLNDAIRLIYLCIVYTFSKIVFTCKIKQLYISGIMTKESCLTYVLSLL